MTKRDPQPLFIPRLSRYNLMLFFFYLCIAAACIVGYILDDEQVKRFRISVLVLGCICGAQLPFYFLSFWYKRDRDKTNFLVLIIDLVKYILSGPKHCVEIWVLVELFKLKSLFNVEFLKVICLYPAAIQALQTGYCTIVPLFIIIYLKCLFCCGATKLKPGQTHEEILIDYVYKKTGTGK